MHATTDLDPNLGLPLWRALVEYFRRHPPLVQADQRLPETSAGAGTRLISRVWHGWARAEKADAYESFLRDRSLPAIRAKGLPGFHGIQLARRPDGDEVEFITEMWFDDLEAVKRYAGEDYTRPAVLPEAAAMLSRYDSRVQHYEIRIEK
jgi:heme-degrading monooxygenase HmoA